MSTDVVNVVRAWHQALNASDVERLVELSSEAVELGGPRGVARGVQELREWVARAGLRLAPRRTFNRGDTVVVEQDASWPSLGSGEAADPQPVASVFVVMDGRVSSIIRYPDLAAALGAAGLTDADQV